MQSTLLQFPHVDNVGWQSYVLAFSYPNSSVTEKLGAKRKKLQKRTKNIQKYKNFVDSTVSQQQVGEYR